MRNLLFLLSLVFLVSCYHQPIIPIGQGIRDTIVIIINPGGNGSGGNNVNDSVCFNSQVLPLYVSYCAQSGCHDAITKAEGVELTSYTTIMKGITPFNGGRSKNYTEIGNGMPPAGYPKVSPEQMNIILKWINQGAKNTNCVSNCDTTKFTFSDPVQMLLSNNCNGCHGTKPGSGNIYLGDYASAKAYINSNKTVFLNSINYSPLIAASKRMPPGGKMADCQIGQFSKWIEKGFPQ